MHARQLFTIQSLDPELFVWEEEEEGPQGLEQEEIDKMRITFHKEEVEEEKKEEGEEDKIIEKDPSKSQTDEKK